MKVYISDLHFGHAQAIQFDQRPFADRDEMDREKDRLQEIWAQLAMPIWSEMDRGGL